MIIYLILKKFKYYLKASISSGKIVYILFWAFYAWVFGLCYGMISNEIVTGETDFLTTERFNHLTIMLIALVTIFRMVIPSYSPLRKLFPKYYPLSKLQEYSASVLDDLLTLYFLLMSIFILSGSYYVDSSKFDFLIIGFLVLIVSHLIRRSIQYLFDYQLKISARIIPLLVVAVVMYFGISTTDIFSYNSLQLLITLVVLFFTGLFQESSISESRHTDISDNSNKGNLYFVLLINNKKARLRLLAGLLFKLVFLLGDFFYYTTKGEHLLGGHFIYWFFASPLIIYSYVYNNVWGFWKNIWLNMELRAGDYKAMIGLSTRLMLMPLAIDFAITIPLMLLSGNNLQFVLVFYVTAACYLLMLSFFWSLITPRKISTSFQLKGSTSSMSNFAALVGILMLTAIKINLWFYVVVLACLLIGGVAYWLSIEFYRDKKYTLVKKLMKE